MADVIKKSTNKFTKGLVMDFSPENTRNEVITHALNATLLTFNGNELSLQNDMGNARVETAYLPEGYIPVGTCEYGGIIYIVSYNPLEDKSQIGCFPSPERNISNEELGVSDAVLRKDYFQQLIMELDSKPSGIIKNTSQYVLLKEDHLNPGDKFLVCSDGSIFEESLSDLYKEESGKLEPITNPVLSLNIVSIEDSGKIVYLNSELRQYEVTTENGKYSYHILGKNTKEGSNFNQESIDIDSYRNVISSGYNVFKSKTSGKLAILAELVMIDSYSVTHSIIPSKNEQGETITGSFDVLINTEVSPNLTNSNFATSPKLSYYFLQKSQGYLQRSNMFSEQGIEQVPLFNEDGSFSLNFLDTPLRSIYEPTSDINLLGTVSNSGKFRFPSPETYQGKMLPYTDNNLDTSSLYTKVLADYYYRINAEQVKSNLPYFAYNNIDFYVYDPTGEEWKEWDRTLALESHITYYTKESKYSYVDAERRNYQPGVEMFKTYSIPNYATEAIIKDPMITKYIHIQGDKYVKVDPAKWDNITTLYTKVAGSEDEYQKINTTILDPSTDYYERLAISTYAQVTQAEAESGEYANLMYYPSEPEFYIASAEDVARYWDFERYPREDKAPWGLDIILYYSHMDDTYIEASEEALNNYYKEDAEPLFYQSHYVKIKPEELDAYSGKQLFLVPYRDSYFPYEKFKPNIVDNYVRDPRPSSTYDYRQDGPQFDARMYTYTLAEFIPQKDENDHITLYEDFKLGSIKLPRVVSDNDLDLPFKYNYTIVPCMNYGRLDHLAISNTVDFSKLHAFNHSNFTTWKYHIDGNQLRLTFGAEIFDTYEDYKVDGLVLEFYDLWGFAGSLEINDKKAYSGVFTKIISLNTPDALSKKKINGSDYTSNFKHNINIIPQDNSFEYNNYSVEYNKNSGWTLNDVDNDCGVLYSNVLYGVKTYIRQTTADGYKFTPKKELFLYTLPIFNDFYYEFEDFNTIENPTLDLILTYKISDIGTVVPYNSNTVIDGYGVNSDYPGVSQYLKGQYENTNLSGTCYYKYTGTSQLNLEIGLKQEYEQYNLSYSHHLNDIFSCKLRLISNDNAERTFNVNDGSPAALTSLNYKEDSQLSVNSNKLAFANDANYFQIPSGEFTKYNFITSNGGLTLPIYYEFIVGYPFTITDIRATEVPMTTICALFHKNSEDRYNLSDFGLVDISTSDTPIYLSQRMFMNSGTNTSELFGIIEHYNVTGKANEQYKIVDSVTRNTITRDLSQSKKLNAGEPMELASRYVGKLTFLQPHAHIDPTNSERGVNVENQSGVYKLISDDNCAGYNVSDVNSDTNTEDIRGVRPYSDLFDHPLYTMTVNTKNSINTYEESISTMDYKPAEGNIFCLDVNDYWIKGEGGDKWENTTGYVWGKLRVFTGFTGEQLQTFYSKFANTMKNIYAYNSDYDQVSLQVGKVVVNNNPIAFTSNLLSVESNLNFETGKVFNDYVYLGPFIMTNYLKNLQHYSESENGTGIKVFKSGLDTSQPKPQVNFQPNYTYLGTPDSYYLVTSLTYNTQVPPLLTSQLELNTTNNTCVRKEDGSYVFVEGSPNKNLLYGFDSQTKKLVQLDVSNYIIASDGTLTLKPFVESGQITSNIEVTSENIEEMLASSYKYDFEFTSAELGNSKASFTVRMDLPSEAVTTRLPNTRDLFYINTVGKSFTPIQPTIVPVVTTDSYSYDANIDRVSMRENVHLEVSACVIKHSSMTEDDWKQQSAKTLNTILTGSVDTSIELYTIEGSVINTTVSECRVYASPTVEVSAGNIEIREQKYADYLCLCKVTVKQLPVTISRALEFGKAANSIIYVSPTKNYVDRDDHKYKVQDKYNSARIRGTSIVINDLYFDPLSSGHRLYMRGDKYEYDGKPRARIYYRAIPFDDSFRTWSCSSRGSGGVARGSTDYTNYNNLWLHKGPCFTDDNLN